MKHICEYRVYYEDTDAGGVVYYANYLKFAERGRTELLRARGFDNSSLWKDQSCGFVVRRIEADYKKPARLDDMLRIETEVQIVKNGSFDMVQTIFCQKDLLFSITVNLVCVGCDFRPMRIPLPVKEALKEAIGNE